MIMEGAISLFVSGGIFMWPLLLLSLIGWAIVVERIFGLLGLERRNRRTLRYMRGGAKGAAKGLLQGIDQSSFDGSRGKAEEALEKAYEGAMDRASVPLEVLAAIGGIAPLVGFIGTVSGMISSFGAIAGADRVSVRLIAGGISEALVTTAFGLVIAIPCVVMEQASRFYLRRLAHRAEDELGAPLDRLYPARGAEGEGE